MWVIETIQEGGRDYLKVFDSRTEARQYYREMKQHGYVAQLFRTQNSPSFREQWDQGFPDGTVFIWQM